MKIEDKKNTKEIKEIIERLTIQNDVMFYHVMQDKKLCEELLNRILGKSIHIKESTAQSTIFIAPKVKGVRLDIFAQDEEKNNYDIEMQIVNGDSIAKRMRIYQASIDLAHFNTGEKYKDAKNTIIIFICMFDPFNKGLPVYTFENTCREDNNIVLEDGTLKIAVVPALWYKVENIKLRAVLKYIKENIPTDDYTKELDMRVGDIKIKYDRVISNDSISYVCKMQDMEDYLQHIKDSMQHMEDSMQHIEDSIQKGRIEGRIEGKAEGRAEGSYDTKVETAKRLRSMGLPIADIAKATLLSETEISQL